MGFGSPNERDTFEGDDVGISPHAVDQRSDWPASEAVECHFKCFAKKKYPCDAASRLDCSISNCYY